MTRLLLAALVGCAHPCPKCPIAAPHVEYVKPPTCNLPELPEPISPQIVGWPTPEQVIVTRTDLVAVVSYVTGLHDWIRAAAGCLK